MDARDTPKSDLVTVLGPNAKFKGELVIDGPGRVLGSFEGTIRATELEIGAGANCLASIEAGTIIIDGNHQGDVIARDCLQLSNKAHVQGDVTATALAVAQGATFVGRCVVGPEALATVNRPTPEAKASSSRKGAGGRGADWLEPGVASSPPDWLGQPTPPVSVRPWVNNAAAAAAPASVES